MPESLSLAVKDVDGPNPSGWYEVLFEDDAYPKASTKNEELAKVAFQSRGSEAEVTLSKVVKGKFTNIYLNAINGVKDTPVKRAGTAASSAAPRDNNVIGNQWAIGRSTELLIASDRDFDFPLNAETMSDLILQAKALVEMRDKLTK